MRDEPGDWLANHLCLEVEALHGHKHAAQGTCADNPRLRSGRFSEGGKEGTYNELQGWPLCKGIAGRGS